MTDTKRNVLENNNQKTAEYRYTQNIECLEISLKCPICGELKMEYDSMLNLHCLNCGYYATGSFT